MKTQVDRSQKQAVAIFGATGSIGASTLAVIDLHPNKFSIFALTANTNVHALYDLCVKYEPSIAVLADKSLALQLEQKISILGINTRVYGGEDALLDLAEHSEVDIVVAAIVGAAGLGSCFKAANAGKKILLANKESVVIAGKFLLQAAQENGAQLIPLDSEHNAIFQCHPVAHGHTPIGKSHDSVSKIYLTASGGPFLHRDIQTFSSITPEQACAHPRWNMGKKISVDSATMMNKGLELIEASVLFGLPAQQIEVVIHPQSVIHSMVEYSDGSVLAQLGTADMRIPIAYALGLPERMQSGAKRLDLFEISQLDFIRPDHNRFPSLRLAAEASKEGSCLPVVMNAANEVYVQAFLQQDLCFTRIAINVEIQMQKFSTEIVNNVADVIELDRRVRMASMESLKT